MAFLFATSWEMSTLGTEATSATVPNFTRITSGTGLVSGAAAQLNITGAGAINFMRYIFKTTNYAGVGYFRFKFTVITAPSAQTQIAVLFNASNVSMGEIRLNSNNTVALFNSSGVQVGSSSSALTVGTTYAIEYKHDSTANPAIMELRIDDVTVASGNAPAQNLWTRMSIGCPVAGGTLNVVYDDFIVFDGTGSLNNSYIGKDAKVVTSTPSATGDSNAWLSNTGAAGTTSNWSLVAGTTLASTPFVESNTLNALDLYNVDDQSLGASDTVQGMMVFMRNGNVTAADAVTAFSQVITKTSGGTQALSAPIIPNSTGFSNNGGGSVQITGALILENDPDGASWTPTTINSMQMGVKLTTTGTNMIKVTNMWTNIVYTPVAVVASGQESSLMLMGMGS